MSTLDLPPLLAKAGRRVPAHLVSLHFVAGLELARRFLWLTPPPELEGRRFAITVEDLGLRSSFMVRGGAFRAVRGTGPAAPSPADRGPGGGGPADLELGARLADFVALLREQTDADTLFFQRRLRISGDTELGLIVKNWLDAAPRPAWLRQLNGADG